MDKEDLASLNRARVTAGWSYLGAIIPIIGFILGGISLSNLSSIEASDSGKAKRRIASVKKMAIGGIALSLVVALLYGTVTVLNIQNNNKVANAKIASDISDCKHQVGIINTKIISYNNQFTTPKNVAFTSLTANVTNENDCEKNTASTISYAKEALGRSLSAVSDRCLDQAAQDNEKLLKANATSTKQDANGQTIYYSSQANMDRIQQTYQADKDNCSTQYPAATL